MIEAGLKLTHMFQDVGGSHGFAPVSARYHPFKEFKVQWQRRGMAADFLITDYMKTADQELVEDFAEGLFYRMKIKRHKELYSPMMKDWLCSKTFLEKSQPQYLQRSRNLTLRSQGGAHDLKESYDRLYEQGLVKELSGTYLSWTIKPNRQRVGYCSALMRVIAISSLMDSEQVPEFVSDYVLYHELLHLEDGLKFTGPHHGPEFRHREHQFPRWEEAELWLKRLAAGSVRQSVRPKP